MSPQLASTERIRWGLDLVFLTLTTPIAGSRFSCAPPTTDPATALNWFRLGLWLSNTNTSKDTNIETYKQTESTYTNKESTYTNKV